MLLKKLAVVTTAATIFGVGTLALATDDLMSLELRNNYATKLINKSGFYIRGEGSYSSPDSRIETSKKIEIQYGNNTGVTDRNSFISSKSQGFSGRFAIGYDFNALLGIETGANFIHPLQKSLIHQEGIIFENDVDDHEYLSNITFNAAVDLLGTVTFPLQNNFYAFAKGGVVYTLTQTVTKYFKRGEEDPSRESTYYTDYFRPKIAVGIGYNINEQVSTDISYSRIFGTQNKIAVDDHLPSLSFTTIAVNYKF